MNSKTTTKGSTAAADARAAGKAASTATSTAPADPKATATLQQPEPTASAMTKQLGNPGDGKAPGGRYPAKDSNEGQTGVTSYTVQPGFSVSARGRQYGEGQQVPLNHVDAARLVEQGRVAASGENRQDHPLAHHLDANAPEVIAMLEQGGLGAEDLGELATLEQGGKDRKTVLEAIEAARAQGAGE